MKNRFAIPTMLAIACLVAASPPAVAADNKDVQPPALDPFNSSLSVTVGADARFSQGAFPDASNGQPTQGSYKTTYGWPSTGTSYTTIRIDGVDHVFGDSSGTFTAHPSDVDALTNSSVWSSGGISVTQTIQLVTNPDTGRVDTAAFTYEATNTTPESHEVGIRMMIDTDINDNDGAPFRIPGVGSVTSEVAYAGAAIPEAFQVFQSLSDNHHIAAARLRGANATAPDQLIIGAWPGLQRNAWDYTVTPGATITNDSAYAIYWNPQALAPQASRLVRSYYGLSDVTVDLVPPIAVGLTGPTALQIVDGAYSPNPFAVTATVSNIGTGPATGLTATLSLTGGLSTSEPVTVALGDFAAGSAERQITWNLTAAPRSQAGNESYTVTISGSNVLTKVLSRSVSVPLMATPCPDYKIFGLRGSGQTASDFSGFGYEVAIAELTAKKIAIDKGKTADAEAINYDSLGVDSLVGDLFSPLISWPLVNKKPLEATSYYAESMFTGSVRLGDAITKYEDTCHAAGKDPGRMIIIGYSQGAAAANWLARSLTSEQLSRTGILLIGDPLRHPADSDSVRIEAGTAAASKGLLQLPPDNLNTTFTRLPAGVAKRTVTLCNPLDIVCDTKNTLLNADVREFTKVHTSYTADELRSAGTLVFGAANS